MTIQSYNLDATYSLQIRPDFVSDTKQEVESNLEQYIGNYILIKDQDNQIFFVQDNLNGTYSLLPAYDLVNYSIKKSSNLFLQGDSDVVPMATGNLISFLPVDDIIIDSVFVSANGDGKVFVKADGAIITTLHINRQNANPSVKLDIEIPAGTQIDVDVRCEARGTANFNSTITYK